MKNNINTLRLELFINSKIIFDEMEKMVIKLQLDIKNKETSACTRKMLENDIKRIWRIKRQLRDLEIMTGFYNPNNTYQIDFHNGGE